MPLLAATLRRHWSSALELQVEPPPLIFVYEAARAVAGWRASSAHTSAATAMVSRETVAGLTGHSLLVSMGVSRGAARPDRAAKRSASRLDAWTRRCSWRLVSRPGPR